MKVGHGTKSSVEFIKRQRPRVFGLTEMDLGRSTALPVVRAVFGMLVRIFSLDRGGHSQEIPWVLRRAPWVRVMDFKLYQLSVDGPDKLVGGMGNDRWAARLQIKVWRKVWVLWLTHLDAGVQHTASGPQLGQLVRNPAGRARWDRYQKEITKLQKMVGADVSDRRVDVVVLEGDMNMLPIGDGVSSKFSPYQMFHKSLHMSYMNSRVGYIFVHGARIKKHKVFKPGAAGWESDHAGILAWVG
jgi:hypothetical protein